MDFSVSSTTSGAAAAGRQKSARVTAQQSSNFVLRLVSHGRFTIKGYYSLLLRVSLFQVTSDNRFSQQPLDC